jgi:DNA repair protein RecO (recombination protein O)
VALYRDEGVVLRTHALGEADRIVSLLTAARGKVRAVAKGARKPGSRFAARLEPTAHVALQLYEGRSNLDTVTQAESVESFRGLREDYAALTAALAILEATDQVAQECEVNEPLYRMLVGALRTLARHPSHMVAPAYFWKLLSMEGFRPHVEACMSCGVSDGLVALLPEVGGATCEACAPQQPGPASGSALRLVQLVLGGGLAEALATPEGAATLEVERLAVRAMEYHLERRLRSAALLTTGAGHGR